MTAAPYYRTRPSPTHQGRWLVVHTVPGTHVESIDDDCPTLASADKAAAWREAERDQATGSRFYEAVRLQADCGT